MKFLHSADLHIGITLDRHSRREEQAAVLDEIIAIAAAEQVDLVLLAGDIYDSFIPSAQGECLLYSFLERLCDQGRRAVVVIAGNHDQPERLAAARELVSHRGVYIAGLPGQGYAAQTPHDGVFIEADGAALHLRLANGERAIIAALPYLSEARAAELVTADLRDEQGARRDYQQALKAELARMAAEFCDDAACFVLAHLFVAGGSSSESERPLAGVARLGGSYGVPRDIFPPNSDYIALGHLHRPQSIGAENCRYAGSPLAYSFSEADQSKSVVLGEILRDQDGEKSLHIRTVPLNSARPLSVWRAESYEQALEWCAEEEARQTWVNLYIRLEQPLSIEQLDELNAAHPYLVAINPLYAQSGGDEPADEAAPLSILEQFSLFAAANSGAEADEALLAAFVALLEAAREEDAS